jgi:hypothetical protein
MGFAVRSQHQTYRASLSLVLCAAAMSLAMAASSCGPADGAEGSRAAAQVVFTQVPAGGLVPLADARSLRDPYAVGSRVVIWSPEAASQKPRVLSEGLAAAGDPVVSFDGQKVLFSGRRDTSEPWGIYEVDRGGGSPRRITPTTFTSLRPAYLPDGRIIFVADAHEQIDPADGGRAMALFACRLDGTELSRLSFGLGSDTDPVVLRDGRILYASRQPPTEQRPAGGWALFTIRNDGTAISGFAGTDSPAMLRQPWELPDRRIAMISLGRESAGDEVLETVQMRRPLKTRAPLLDGPDMLFRSASAGVGRQLIVSHRLAGSSESFRLSVSDLDHPSAGLRTLFDDPAFDEIDARAMVATTVPKGQVSTLKPGTPTGEILCIDARRTQTSDGREASVPARTIRIYKATAPTAASAPVGEELIAEMPLAADGSLRAKLPADVALRFETLDEAGRALMSSRTWVWLRPAETRGCIGCHENPEVAPPNRVPLALKPAPANPKDAAR